MSDDWVATVQTEFGRDVHLQHMTGFEELGRPFRYQLELLSTDLNMELDKQLGNPIVVTLQVARGGTRHFHGCVHQVSFAGVERNQARYIAHVRPDFWFLNHSSDNRIFQDKTVVDIVKAVLDLHKISYRFSTKKSYRDREYCVQYGETDFEFVSRLLEEEGMYYYFEHSASEHVLVIVDSPSNHSAMPGYSDIKYFPPEHRQREEDHISSWELSHQVDTQKFTVNSYNYEHSRDKLLADSTLEPGSHGQGGKEQYEYGKLYPTKQDGRNLAEVRVQEQQTNYTVATGTGNVLGLSCGYVFNLMNYPRSDANAGYLVIGANYEFENNELDTNQSGSGASFRCFVQAIKESVQFRPARLTQKAVIKGPQTATVVGKKGEEIWTDNFGRVKVQFHWDRQGENNEQSSCWVRVSTALAGQKFGFVAIPRIGQEVIVDFLEGDPDQPIITGSVYNDANMPPYDLPANQTQIGLKSRSSKGGKPGNFNELRFEDKKGSEEVFFHAENNFNRVVKNNDSLKVGLVSKDKGDQTIEIHNDRTATLNEGTDKLTIKKGHQNIEITEGDQSLIIKGGNQKIDVKKKITIVAGDELSIKVGQASLNMKKNGDVTIKGMKLTFQATNSVTVKGTSKVDINGGQVKIAGSIKTEVKAAMTKVEGSGILDLKAGGMAKLKGGVTMIG